MQQFVDQYSKALYLLLIFIVDDSSNAEKILHKTLREAILKIDSYNPDKEGIFIWLIKQAIPLIDLDRSIIIEKFQLLNKSLDTSLGTPTACSSNVKNHVQ